MPKTLDCTFCGQSRTETIQKAEDPFEVVKCRSCGLVFTRPQPDKGSIAEHYQEEYYKEWIEKQMKRRIPMWKKRLKELLKYKKSGRLLDVGFGSGTFLKLARKNGFEVSGTEISEYACQYVKHHYGIAAFKGDLEEARFPSESFDAVTLWHALEHLPDPRSTLEEIHRILKKDGVLVVAVPNLNNFITRILYFLAKGKKLKLFSINAKELHLWHFSPQTLSRLLQETGYGVLNLKLDLAQIEFPKKIVDFFTLLVYSLTRRNYGEAFKIYASKL